MNPLQPLLLWFILLVLPVIALNVPVILLIYMLRHRVTPLQRRIVLAAGFGAAAAYEFWRLWFFDLFPPPAGPPARYYATTIVPWSIAFAAAGWILGSTLKLKTRNYELESISKSK